MATLTPSENGLLGSITLTKQTGTLLTLATDDTYVDDDIQFTIGVQSGAGASNSASASAVVESTDGSAEGFNIYGSIGAKQSSEPASGYYIRVKVTGSGSSKIVTPGWLDIGNLPSASANETAFFPVSAAGVSVTVQNELTPSATINGTNVTLNNVDNGIEVVSTGGCSARATPEVNLSTAGYIRRSSEVTAETIYTTSQTAEARSFISGVTLSAPASGTRSFSITVPNGSSTMTITYTVDSDGNVYIS